MTYLDSYINTLPFADLKTSVVQTSTKVYENVLNTFHFNGQTTGLLMGNVQSGKTAQMLGIISKLADEGYKLFLLLTTDISDLQRQTFKRVKNSLIDFNVYSETDSLAFLNDGITRPTILILKKNSRILRKWRTHLLTSSACRGLSLVIFDDEGDAASLNTFINRHSQSTINLHLDRIKSTADAGTLYFEVTATPQAIILQSTLSDWRPSFINYFKPGQGYLGGNFFYSYPTSYTIKFTGENELADILGDDDNVCPTGLQMSIMSFLVNCAHKRLNGDTNCNFMIHPSSRIYAHEKFVKRVQEHLNLLLNSEGEEDFDELLYETWRDLQSSRPDLEHFEDIKAAIGEILSNGEIRAIPLNSRSFICRDSNNPDALDLSKGYNVVVGGNTLGRGITFPHLQTVYYCRTSKKPQADTFWQHSRIFGYDRERELIRIFIPQTLHRLFVNLNESNNIIIKQIENSLDNIQIIYPKNIKPTRRSVLNNETLNLIQGGVNMFPIQPIENNTTQLDPLLLNYSNEESAIVDKDFAINVLSYCGSNNSEDFPNDKFISSIEALANKRPSIKCRMIIRTNRNLSKGTGTLLSENDRILGSHYNDEIVLTVYRVNGNIEQGWNGSPLWIPNIKFPSNCCFYDSE
jgi:hypothetical protein